MAQMTRVPTGSADWTELTPTSAPNWECVNDPIESPNNDDYVYDNVGNVVGDLYSFTAFNIPTGSTINYLRIYHRSFSNVNGSCLASSWIGDGSDIYETPDDAHTLTTTPTLYYDSFPVNPATGLAWTVAQINGTMLQGFGPLVKADGVGNYCRTSQCYALVDYTTPGYNAPGGGGKFATTSSWGWSI